jgi:phosphoglycerate dehydrogenase-like enzyme
MTRPTIVVWRSDADALHWSPEAEQVLASFAEWVDVRGAAAEPPDVRARRLDEALAGADGLVICGWNSQGLGYLSAERLARAPRLRYIGSTAHYRQAEFVDMPAALARGIAFSETAPIMSPWVAEYELALALAALRDIPREHAVVGAGGWVTHLPAGERGWPDRLQGRRVGLASFGEIHRHLARFLAPFETDWQAYDPYVSAETIAAAGGRKAEDLVALAARSEIFFVAVPPTPTNRGLIGPAVIGALPEGAVFVLVGRMAVVDQPPLLARLQAAELRAAIDVYEPEPPPADSPLRTLPNVVHTPHRAGNVLGAHRGVFLGQCEDARRHFCGEPLRYPLRPELVALFHAPTGGG